MVYLPTFRLFFMVNVLNVGIPIPYLDHLQVGEALLVG